VGFGKGAVENMVNPWQGRRVFLTGHTGFKGSWLALWLAHRGSVTRGYALDPETTPNLFTVANVARDIEDIRGDVRDFPKISACLKEFAPEVVFHLAAQPLVRRSYQDPLGTYGTNAMGTAHVLEAVRACPTVRAVVCITTDKCYENQEWIWPYRETDTLGGSDPYASSKACAELIAAAYRNSFFSTGVENRIGIATARAGNVIGGGDWSEDRLVPDLIRGFQAGVPVLIRRPNAVRPWQHVLEAVAGYLLLAERLLEAPSMFSSAYNFGPDERDARSVEQLATALVKMWGGAASWTSDARPGVHEAHLLRLDSSKSRAELCWAPRLALETALEWIVRWHHACQSGNEMRDESLRQITAYEKMIDERSA
jgi:CDP-glucose 4,6-dehydratase